MSEAEDQAARGSARALWLLAAGVALGLATAAAGLLRGSPGSAALPAGVVARVNGRPIEAAELERALQAVAADRREPLDEGGKRAVLERLIDEELLLQRALALDLPRHDRKLRSDLVGALVESVVTEGVEQTPTPAQLEAFYREQRDWFRQPGRLRVREFPVRQAPDEPLEATRQRALEVAERARAGADPEALRRELGESTLPPLPDVLLPPVKLREYLGETGLRSVLVLEVGQASEPVRFARGFRVLQLVEREPDRVPPLAEIEATVAAEWRRRAGERALRSYLDGLREGADLAVGVTLP